MTQAGANQIIVLVGFCCTMLCSTAAIGLMMYLRQPVQVLVTIPQPSRVPSRSRLQELANSLSGIPGSPDLPERLLNPLQRASAYVTILAEESPSPYAARVEKALSEMIDILTPLSRSTS